MRYKADNNEFDGDSIANQRIKAKCVGQNVYACTASMVQYILRKQQCKGGGDAPFETDDIENLLVQVCEECGGRDFTETEAYKCEWCETIHETEEEVLKCTKRCEAGYRKGGLWPSIRCGREKARNKLNGSSKKVLAYR